MVGGSLHARAVVEEKNALSACNIKLAGNFGLQ